MRDRELHPLKDHERDAVVNLLGRLGVVPDEEEIWRIVQFVEGALEGRGYWTQQLDVVFDGPPGPVSGRFVVETARAWCVGA